MKKITFEVYVEKIGENLYFDIDTSFFNDLAHNVGYLFEWVEEERQSYLLDKTTQDKWHRLLWNEENECFDIRHLTITLTVVDGVIIEVDIDGEE